jgi:toluene monooxygenase system protein E
VPLGDWYRRYQPSALVCDDWDRFVDPRETIREVRGLPGQGRTSTGCCDRSRTRLRPKTRSGVVDTGATLPPLRHLYHGLQMLAAYVGQMAPSGRITIVAALQAADEMRRVHRLAYRMAMLRRLRPGFGETGKQLWERDPVWQPLRRLVEMLLVTWDWGEAFAAVNLGEAVLDRFFLGDFATGRAPGAITCWARSSSRWPRTAPGLAPGRGRPGSGGVRRCRQSRPARGVDGRVGMPPRRTRSPAGSAS